MPYRVASRSLAALLLCGAVLAGCGGGDAEPPPPPVGETPAPGPDTTPPTVSIASDFSAPTATGPVTFTFVFSEDVGVSFEQADIAVAGGSAGTFTRVDGRQATLVVAPNPGVAGTMTVSVGPGTFADIAGNPNTDGASASQAYMATQTITFASPGDQTIGTPPLTLSATASSGLPVTITATTPSVCTVSGTTLTLVAAGTCSLTATQPGDGTFVPAEPVSQTFAVTGRVSQTITFTSPGDQTLGTPTPPLSASATSGLPVTIASTTPSVCTASGTTLTLVAAGDCSLTATQPGDGTYAPAAPVTQTFKVTGGAVVDLVFSSGFAGGNRTVEGGAYFSYSGSNLDGFSCTGGPAWCGSGDGGSGATSFYYSYYQTPTAATALYNGISVLAPGVTSISATGNTPGLQVTGQTTVEFTFNNNPEWQASGTNNFGVLLTLGKFYDLDAGAAVQPCNIKLLAVVTPQNGGAATLYKLPLSSFQIIQACNTGISTVAAALASSPVSEVAFQAAGGGAALPPVGGKSTGANLSVAAGGLYPTTLALTGGIKFGVSSVPPPAAKIDFSTGFAGGNRTVEGGAYFSYSGSNLDGFSCTGGPAWCGSGDGGSGATSFYYSYYQTPTAATALYNGISVLAPGVTTISATGDTPGVNVTTQTTVNFTFNNNPEWQASGTNNFGVLLTLGKFYDLDAGAAVQPCNIKLLAVVTPQNGGAATLYKLPLSSFQIIQACNTGVSTVAAALASSPVSEVAFQAAGGGAALPPVGGKSTGANLSVAAGGLYPTTLALTGGISFEP